MRSSFHQHQQELAAPTLEADATALDDAADAVAIDGEESVEAYHGLVTHAERVEEQIRDVVRQPDHCVPFLQPGRLLRVRDVKDATSAAAAAANATADAATSSGRSSTVADGGADGATAVVAADAAGDAAGSMDFGWGTLVTLKDHKKDGERVVLLEVLLKVLHHGRDTPISGRGRTRRAARVSRARAASGARRLDGARRRREGGWKCDEEQIISPLLNPMTRQLTTTIQLLSTRGGREGGICGRDCDVGGVLFFVRCSRW